MPDIRKMLPKRLKRPVVIIAVPAACVPVLLGVPAAAAAGPDSSPTNGTAIVAQGPRHSLNFYWQAEDSKTWQHQRIAGDSSAYSAPSVAQAGSEAVVAVEGPHNSLAFYWELDGSTKWHREAVAGAGTTFSAPALAHVADSSVIVAEGPLGRLYFYWQQLGTTVWHPELVAGKHSTYSAPSVAWVDDTSPSVTESVIAAEGPDQRLDFYTQAVGAKGWHSELVAGKFTTYAAPSVAQVGTSSTIAAAVGCITTGRRSARRPGTKNWSPGPIRPILPPPLSRSARRR